MRVGAEPSVNFLNLTRSMFKSQRSDTYFAHLYLLIIGLNLDPAHEKRRRIVREKMFPYRTRGT